jgi:hypothetical protein
MSSVKAALIGFVLLTKIMPSGIAAANPRPIIVQLPRDLLSFQVRDSSGAKKPFVDLPSYQFVANSSSMKAGSMGSNFIGGFKTIYLAWS